MAGSETDDGGVGDTGGEGGGRGCGIMRHAGMPSLNPVKRRNSCRIGAVFSLENGWWKRNPLGFYNTLGGDGKIHEIRWNG